jgi:hypothetical protein
MTSATRTVTVSNTQSFSVSLASPSSGATFTAPATIPLSASVSGTTGSIARVDFYQGQTLIGSDTSSPYSMSWSNVSAGSYALTAIGRDRAGASTVSSTRDITVVPANLPRRAVFTPSSNHATAVDRYVLELFSAGADTRVANPVAMRDLGKPSVASGVISVDIASTIMALNPGYYVATVTAVGNFGSTQSAASPQFRR